MARILVVEDDRDLTELIKRWLTAERHLVELVHSGFDALPMLKMAEYDLVILDWKLPGLSGLEICAQFRSDGGNSPVLFLTAKDTIAEKEEGFSAGADDYLTKPFHARELLARVKALLRRPKALAADHLKVGNLELDIPTHSVTKSGQEIRVTPKEFDLLEFLMRHPDEVFSAEALLARVWAGEANTSTDAVRTVIMQLRKKIEGTGETPIIQTLHGRGYKLTATVG